MKSKHGSADENAPNNRQQQADARTSSGQKRLAIKEEETDKVLECNFDQENSMKGKKVSSMVDQLLLDWIDWFDVQLC